MDCFERYYARIYRQTQRLCRKMFGKNIVETLSYRYALKQELERRCGCKVEDVTEEILMQKRLAAKYAEYLTVCKVIRVIECACEAEVVGRERSKI